MKNKKRCVQTNVGCVTPSACHPKLRRPNLSYMTTRMLGRHNLSWGDVTWGNKAMG